MTIWQRRLRAIIAVFGLGFAIVVYVAIREGKPPAGAPPAVPRVDPSSAAETTGGELRQLKGTREDFRVEYDRSMSYPDGRQRLLGARIFVDEREGRTFQIHGTEAEVGGDQDRVDFRGGVELTSGDGLTATAPEATYTQSEGMVRASGATAFTQGRLSGTSRGLTYDKNRDMLSMPEQAVLRMAAPAPDAEPVQITSGSAGLARRDHYARFEGGFTLVHGARTLNSDQATAYLTDDQSKVQVLEMRGHSRITGLGESAGALRAMQADDVNLEFADDGRTLRGATLSNNASIEVAGSGDEARRIAGRWIEIRMASDGTTVTALSVRDSVRLDLPAEARQGTKTVQARTLAAGGENEAGLSSATFTDDVEYRETPPGSAVTRVARARSMALDVEPGFGGVNEARFDGAFTFEEDKVRASAAQAQYNVEGGVVELTGVDAATGDKPRVTDGATAIEAATVTLTLEGPKIAAEGEVRSTLLPARPAGAASDSASGTTRSSLLQDDQPVFAASESLAYDGGAQRARYAGNARLWQGDTAIHGDVLEVDDSTGNLSANGHVRSTLMLEKPAEGTDPVERVPTIAAAGVLVYEEASRKATYSERAHVSGPQGDLRAGRIELVLAESGKQLERVEGYSSVVLQDGDRQATGDRLTFFEGEGRYLMQGRPVRIVVQCRETVGRSLTFYKSADTIIVDGNEETRTLTKGGAPCGERRSS